MGRMRTIIAAMLCLALTGTALGGVSAASAEGNVPALNTELQAEEISSSLAMETEDGNSSDINGAVQTSSFDAINVTERTSAGASSMAALTYVLGGYNAAGAEFLMVQYENCSLQNEYGFTITLWGNGTQNAAEGTYYLVQSPTDETGIEKAIAWGNFFQSAAYSGWLKIPVSLFPGETWNSIGAINFNIDFPNQLRCRINIGEIGFLKGGVYTCAVKPSELTITPTNTNAPNTVVMENKPDCIALTKISAGEVLYDPTLPVKDQAITLGLNLGKTDLSGYAGIRFYAENDSSNKLYLQKWFAEKEYGETWYCNRDNYWAIYYPDGGSADYGDAFYIPAGYRGYILIPFSTFFPGWGSACNGIMELGEVEPYFYFLLDHWRDGGDAASANPTRFILTDFALVRAAERQPVANTGDVRVFMPFEYDSTEELRLYWESRYRAQAGVEVASVDTPTPTQGVSGRAMHFTCGGLSLTPGAQPFATALDWTPTDKVSMTIGSAKGLTFWIKNTSGMQIAFRIGFDLRIVDGNGTITTQRWETDDGARYLLLDTVTGSERIGASKNGIAIPAGFEGWVRIGFEQFSMPAWVTATSPFDPTNDLCYIVIGMNALTYEGASFIMDSLGYYYTDIEVTTPFHQTANSFAAAMAGSVAENADKTGEADK